MCALVEGIPPPKSGYFFDCERYDAFELPDSDDLPDYETLDSLLEQIIEGGRSAESLEPPEGCRQEDALAVAQRLDRNEYKRRQSPLVLRTSPKAFGTGRRLPIVHRSR